jgi:hypothetical protein
VNISAMVYMTGLLESRWGNLKGQCYGADNSMSIVAG